MSDHLVKINDSKEDRQLEFFNSLQEDSYDQYLKKIPSDKLTRIKKSINRIQTVHASAPLTCWT